MVLLEIQIQYKLLYAYLRNVTTLILHHKF